MWWNIYSHYLLTRSVTFGILLPTAIRADGIAKTVILGIVSSISFMLLS